MVWDGSCGFCRYWITRWQLITGEKIHYVPYQQAHKNFPDLDVDLFRQAVRLIETDGAVYSGPHAALKALHIGGRYSRWLKIYERSPFVRRILDGLYCFVARKRKLMMTLTRFSFGSNPTRLKPYWLLWLLAFVGLVALLMRL
ncbi:MAG: hypothetical protein Kow0075_06400 [Salibacteraceae bacterium]